MDRKGDLPEEDITTRSPEDPAETENVTDADRQPEEFYEWKNEGGAHLPHD